MSVTQSLVVAAVGVKERVWVHMLAALGLDKNSDKDLNENPEGEAAHLLAVQNDKPLYLGVKLVDGVSVADLQDLIEVEGEILLDWAGEAAKALPDPSADATFSRGSLALESLEAMAPSGGLVVDLEPVPSLGQVLPRSSGTDGEYSVVFAAAGAPANLWDDAHSSTRVVDPEPIGLIIDTNSFDLRSDSGTFSFGGPDENGGVKGPPPDGVTELPGVPSHAAGQLLVQFSGDANDVGKLRALEAIGGQIEEIITESAGPYGTGGQLALVSFDPSLPTSRAIDMLLKDEAVEIAEQNWYYETEALVSDDTYYTNGSLWGMYGDTTSPSNQFGSHADEAWATGFGGSMNVVVGVIDTGIDPTHPDLYLNIWLNQMEIPSDLRSSLSDIDQDGLITYRDLNDAANADYVSDLNGNSRIDALDLLADPNWADGVDTSGNGRVDDLAGWNFWGNNNQPFLASDGDEHGTHVAGTIGGIGGNGTGVVGVNFDVQLMPLKFLGKDGGYTSGAISALDYHTWYAQNDTSLDYPATNNSWGGGGFSTSLQDAIVRGGIQDVLFVAAAGNNSNDADSNPSYPAAYTTIEFLPYEAVLSVAAINSTGGLAWFSNYGDVSVDLGAPGVDIWSTTPNGGYSSYNGTSMASPHVAGGLALYAAANPTASAAEIRDILLQTVTETGSLQGKTVTDGRLDISTMMEGMTDAPVYVLGMVVNDSTIASDETLEVTITFSKGVTFDATGLVYEGAALTHGTLTSNVDGTTWVATFTPAAGVISSVQTVGVKAGSYTALDGSASEAPATTSGEFTVDTVAPEVSSISMTVVDDANSNGLTTGESATIEIGFTEAVTGFDTTDIKLTDQSGVLIKGTLEGLQSANDGQAWTVTFTPDAGQSGEFSVTVAESYTDVAGNSGTIGTQDGFALDTTDSAPGVSRYGTDGSESVFGGAGDDIISGLPEGTSFNGAGTIDFLYGYGGADTFILGNETAGIFYDDGNDNAGNTGTNDYAHIKDFGVGGADQVRLIGSEEQYLLADWTMDGIAGTVIAKDVSGRNFGGFDSKDEIIAFLEGVRPADLSKTTDADSDFSFVTFTNGLDSTAPVVTVNALTTSDTTPALSGTVDDATAAISVAINSSSYTATNNLDGTWTLADNTITTGLADGTYDVVVTATDEARNSATDSTTADLVIDTTAPDLISIVLNDSDLTVDETAIVTFTFSEAVQEFAITDIDLSEAQGAIADLTTNDNITWTAVFTPTPDVADTTNTISVADNVFADFAGNLGTGEGSENFTIDTVPSTGPIGSYGTDTGSESVTDEEKDGGIISGLSQSGTGNGAGTIDMLTGGTKADIFLLGDARGVFYDDGSGKPGSGNEDYAHIFNFDTENDLIQLVEAQGYITKYEDFYGDTVSDTLLYLDTWKPGTDDRDELIAVVDGVNLTDPNDASTLDISYIVPADTLDSASTFI